MNESRQERFSGIIFDFNGVLWWDNALQEASWRDWSAELRGYPMSDEEMAEHVHGRNNSYTQQYLSTAALTDAQAEQLSEQKEILYRRRCLELGQGFKLSPGAESLLDFLVEQEIPHTIATASGRGNVDFFVEHLDLGRWFDVTGIVYDDGKMAGKPAPDFYLVAAQRLGLPPEQCIVIEDSISGMRAAQAADIGLVIALLGDGGHALRGKLPDGVESINNLVEFNRQLLST